MVKIRLMRTGRKNKPSYRIIVIDAKSKREGDYIENIGHYNPIENKTEVNYNEERYNHWISVGAQPTSAVKKLISGKYKFKLYNPKGEPEGTEEAKVEATEAPAEAEKAAE